MREVVIKDNVAKKLVAMATITHSTDLRGIVRVDLPGHTPIHLTYTGSWYTFSDYMLGDIVHSNLYTFSDYTLGDMTHSNLHDLMSRLITSGRLVNFKI